MHKKTLIENMLGIHPAGGLGMFLSHSDTLTATGVPHRCLVEVGGQRDSLIESLRTLLVRHHLSPDAIEREKRRRAAFRELGLEHQLKGLDRFPSNSSTRKGNLAEIVLAEYITSATETTLPIYRLRYNPNVDQSMKGDDVLAFDLDSKPVRIIVGESKFRTTSSKVVVTEMVSSLGRSHKGGVPVSLQFVADRLFESGNEELGERVEECARLFALQRLRLDYVGLLMSDSRSADKVNRHTKSELRRLAVISINMDSPDAIVSPCYEGLEKQI